MQPENKGLTQCYEWAHAFLLHLKFSWPRSLSQPLPRHEHSSLSLIFDDAVLKRSDTTRQIIRHGPYGFGPRTGLSFLFHFLVACESPLWERSVSLYSEDRDHHGFDEGAPTRPQAKPTYSRNQAGCRGQCFEVFVQWATSDFGIFEATYFKVLR